MRESGGRCRTRNSLSTKTSTSSVLELFADVRSSSYNRGVDSFVRLSFPLAHRCFVLATSGAILLSLNWRAVVSDVDCASWPLPCSFGSRAHAFRWCHILAWLRALSCAADHLLRAHFTDVSRVLVGFDRVRKGDLNNNDGLNEGQRQCHKASIVKFGEVIDLHEVQECEIVEV